LRDVEPRRHARGPTDMQQLPLYHRQRLRSGLQVAVWWVIGVALFVVPLILILVFSMMMRHMT